MQHGTGTRQLTHPPAGSYDEAPDWAPDGTLVVFTRRDLGATYSDLWVVAPDGSGERRLTAGLVAFHPSWSPDGTKLVFQKEYWIGHDTDLYTTYPDGVGEERIVQFDSSELSPAWQPLR